TKRVFYHLHRHSTLFIMGFRFIYGIRTISPIVIGAAGVGIKRFIFLNIIAAFVWANISCWGGYLLRFFFSDAIESMIKHIENIQKYAVIGLGTFIIAIAAYIYIRRRRGSQEHHDN